MKSKAPLSLMEQLVMLLVFALAAALCLQVFVFSAQTSRWCEARDHAVTEVQNAAEMVKVSRGDLRQCASMLGGTADDHTWQIGYDENWNISTTNADYQLIITSLPTQYAALGSAEVLAKTETGEELFGVTVSWQEVHGE